jgi:hypothetical protein
MTCIRIMPAVTLCSQNVTLLDLNVTNYWDIMPCSLVEFPSVLKECTDTCFLLVTCLVYSASLKMGAVSCSEILVDLYQTTWYCIPVDRTLHNHCCENLKTAYMTDFVSSVGFFFQRNRGNVTNNTTDNTKFIQRIDYYVKKYINTNEFYQ